MKKHNRLSLLLAALVAVAFFFPSSTWAYYVLTPEFGTNGVVLDDSGLGDDLLTSVVTQDDGKIVAAGYVNNGAVTNIAVARYNPDGTPDSSFNSTGKFTASSGTGNSRAVDIALQEDGKIVIAGTAEESVTELVVLRLTSDGFFDATFGDNGRTSLPVGNGSVADCTLQLDPAGNILVGGSGENGSSTYGFLAKFTTEGSLAAGFGQNGIALADNLQVSALTSLEVQNDNSILAVVAAEITAENRPALLRLEADGTIDPSFGTSGIQEIALTNSTAVVTDSLTDTTGDIFLTGYIEGDTSSAAFVAKIDNSGQLDPGFATDGIYASALTADSRLNGIVVVDENTIAATGYVTGSEGKDVLLVTIRTVSASPGETEQLSVVFSLVSGDDTGQAIAAPGDGSIIAAGSASNGTDSDFVLAQFVQQTALATIGGADGTTSGITTSGYRITTLPVINITRVSAMSGGIIEDAQSLPACESSCEQECSDQPEQIDTCLSTCLSGCQEKPTVTLRGIVYGTSNPPEYETAPEESPTPTEDTQSSEQSSLFPQDAANISYFVKRGQTENGSGTGQYTADIAEVTPDTTYFVRAYAVLSDDTVIYGNTLLFTSQDACFIATAAYGTIADKHVFVLREFRDKVLLSSKPGRYLVGTYYRISPVIANLVAENHAIRILVRALLLPVIAFAAFVLYTSLAVKIVLLATTVLTPAIFYAVIKRKEVS
ncbi:delta-60 repeat domain-containing protein [Desulforhopalus singaporensis]|uniref:Delta-60 repeat domain-containing protein n=1 Tax=Desulforhopalus singaporensis TaxID=91360 RepID=A0A1H0M2B9_9BACT|nr:delta-60 repeat domain-containing protein [Desulforhopalus singaporensis]SDO74441.1 delta-60 repeat domain-containing protein [Desulforhopalus singaporensis]